MVGGGTSMRLRSIGSGAGCTGWGAHAAPSAGISRAPFLPRQVGFRNAKARRGRVTTPAPFSAPPGCFPGRDRELAARHQSEPAGVTWALTEDAEDAEGFTESSVPSARVPVNPAPERCFVSGIT